MYVQPEGDKKAKIYIVGEAPGNQEALQGKPFIGGPGMVLNGLLAEAGIQRDKTYITYLVPEKPKGNSFGSFYKDKSRTKPTEDLLEYHRKLGALLKEHKPNVVIVCGDEPLFALTGRKGITKWRGSVLYYNSIKIIPIINPLTIMRQYEFRPITVMDLTKVKKESATPLPLKIYKDRFMLNPSFADVIQTLRKLHNEEYIAFDIETGARQIICMGLGWSETEALCIPFFFTDKSWWTESEELAIIQELGRLFANESIKFIAQNAQFDMTYMLDVWKMPVANLWMDTMVAFHCVYPELRKGLDFLSSIYTSRPYHKGMVGAHGINEGATPTNLWKYNALDCVVTWECAMKIKEDMHEFGTKEFYFKHSHKLIEPLIKMQRRGVKIDIEKRAKIDKNIDKDIIEMQERLTKAVGHELNPLSPKQMKEFLYDELKLPPQIDRKTGNVSANYEVLKKFAGEYPNPIFDLCIDIRKAKKILSTYIRAPLDSDGRIRCSYVITGTETGRLSSRASIHGSGTNLQNIPRGELVRSIFIPDEGKVFINADLSQAEARVVAYLAEEVRLQRVFEQGGDIHRRNAAMVYGKRQQDVTKDERQLAKALVHAANYGIGPRTFSKLIGATENRARELLNQYYALYPCIKIWHRSTEETLRKSRILRTPLGRARMFFGRWSSQLLRSAIAYVPQSTVGDLLNWGIIRCRDAMPPEWEILMQVHDSILMQVPKGTHPMHIHKFIKHYFEIPFRIGRETIKIPTDIQVGTTWANLKELDLDAQKV